MSQQPNHHKPAHIGLTGGIGTGKTTVTNIFAELGVAIVDTDQIARDILCVGQPTYRRVRAFLGETFVQADGNFDRNKIRQYIFADDDKRLTFNGIVHPEIHRITYQQLASCRGTYCIAVVPLLYESKHNYQFQRIIVVDASVETQISRTQIRDQDSPQSVERIVQAQAKRQERLSIADDIIRNDSSPETLREQVMALHTIYMNIFA